MKKEDKQCSMLKLEGILFNSITHEVSNNSLKVGTNVEYAGVHQFGTNKAGRAKKTVIEARPFLLTSPIHYSQPYTNPHK